MKLCKLLLLLLIISSCTPPIKIADDRPTEELTLIKKFHVADSVYSGEENAIKKNEMYDKQHGQLAKFVADTLHAKAVQWQATVYQIELKSYPIDYIEATLLVTPKTYLDEDEKNPDLSNIVLSARVLPDNTIIKDKLKDLLKGDRVLVTGSFEKSKTGDIEFTSKMDDKDYAFSNPKLDFKIENITKITKKLQ